ncbi:GxxExxY protein [Tuwongella immobilis]|uniref:GxxExxY protein n=1 Tax=Tuwongella immobilis TaxID=692036 RepID=A0A6C2YRF1_9BACT|nr:GxxExxY protein [Tuwongella immobilis]VIP03749.1 Putative uncharacterized protein OS=Fischerella sp. JSC-11 GN=FJSC11DRAFT_2751 PE=4 SV=1: PDDEXK_3 [Tuwongella immobilis]VTS04866.1 Putative uncharacterized protein OS=Fischerella sp. JSC-11 GN=FJSC11DRAFT_2751 PE=4 SV=1: PDDEXK_3 [Tuwongella immobilis]
MKQEPSEAVDRLASSVIGAAIEVHRVLGPGYLEKVYEEALAIEFGLRGISCSRQHSIALTYKGHAIGEGRLDFLVGGELIVELKTVDALAEIHKAQVISYLKATGHILGLLINFHVPVLKDGIKRVVYSHE